MDQFAAGSVVWASAHRDIFWPGVVVETEGTAPVPAKKHVRVKFLIEDSYEDIKSPSKIFMWDCEEQNKFIEKGRALKNEERKIHFNKAVAEADNLLKQVTERRVINTSENWTDGPLELNGSKCERKLDKAKANEGKGVLKKSLPPANRWQAKRSAKCNGKRQKVHTLQGQPSVLTSEASETKEHSQVCQGHQSLSKEKRKRKENDSCKKMLPVKKVKSGDQFVLGEVKPEKNEENVGKLDFRTSTSSEDSHVGHAVGTTSICSVTLEGSSDDEELMSEPFSPSQEANNNFSVGDIVWAKYSREPYWPALVKKITGKNKREQKYVVKFLGWNDGRFRIQPKNLEHYAGDQNREKFKLIRDTLKDKELKEQFDEAMDEADDFLTRRGLGKSFDEELDSESDREESIKEGCDEEDEVQSVDDAQTEDKDLQPCGTSVRRRSNRTKKQVSRYKDILSYIRQAKPILKRILDGRRSSERHTTFTSGRKSERNQLKHRAGFGPVGNEASQQIMDMLVEFYKEIKGYEDIPYVSEVWLPEAIIWSIREIDHVDWEKAEKMYLEGSESTVTERRVINTSENWTDGPLELNGSKCERKLDKAKANEGKGVLKKSLPPANRWQAKRSAKCNGKRQKVHTLQGQPSVLTSEASETKEHSQVCQGHQSLSKEKRKRKENDSCKKMLPVKKVKSGDQFVLGEVKPEKNEENVGKLDFRTSTSSEDSHVGHAVGTTSICSVTLEGSSDDEELMSEPFSPSQEANNNFSVGDIVWAKYSREPYWPALVKKITGKNKREQKYVVKFLGWNDGRFRIQPKKLEHYAGDQNREKFKLIRDTLKDKELKEQFDEAMDEADDFLTRRGLGKSFDEELDSESDREESIKEGCDEEDEVQSVDDAQTEDKDLQPCGTSVRRRSNRTKKQVSRYKDILSYIRQAKPILKRILDGRRSSERHTTFTSGRKSERNQLKHRAGFGPVGNEASQQIMDMLVEFYKEIKGYEDIPYVSEVWLPEAIIWSIREIDHVDREKAEKMYLEGSESTVTKAEVEEFRSTLMKRKKVGREEVEERIKRAERVMAS